MPRRLLPGVAPSTAKRRVRSRSYKIVQMAETVRIFIDGEALDVAAFTTIAAALAMRSIAGTRRSVSGEPRAALCGMGVCQECRVIVTGRAHVLGCQTLCDEGLVIQTMATPR